MLKNVLFNDNLKRHVLDCMGYGVNRENLIYDQETYGLLSYKGKFLSFVPVEPLERKKIYFDLYNIGLMNWMFQMFIYNYQEENPDIYIQIYYEDIQRCYPINRSAMIFKNGDEEILYATNYYFSPTFKFIDVMFALSEMYDRNFLFQIDSAVSLLEYQEYLDNEAAKRNKMIAKLYKNK